MRQGPPQLAASSRLRGIGSEAVRHLQADESACREEPCPARPSFACRLRISQYCCLSWEAAKASPNTMLRNGDKRRSHPRVLALLEACWGLRVQTNMRSRGNKF